MFILAISEARTAFYTGQKAWQKHPLLSKGNFIVELKLPIFWDGDVKLHKLENKFRLYFDAIFWKMESK
jgi:hypothetical protein